MKYKYQTPWKKLKLLNNVIRYSGDSVVSKGQTVGIDWNRIARLCSHVLAHMNSLTASCRHIKVSVKENEVPTDKNSSRASIFATKASYISN